MKNSIAIIVIILLSLSHRIFAQLDSNFTYKNIDTYSLEDFSKISKYHQLLKGFYFKADSIVFQNYNSEENQYNFTIHIRIGIVSIPFACTPNLGENIIHLSISQDSFLYQKINYEIEQIYKSIDKKKELIYSPIQEPFIESIVGFARENKTSTNLVGSKYMIDSIEKIQITYQNKILTLDSRYVQNELFRVYSYGYKKGTAGFCIANRNTLSFPIKWKNILSKRTWKRLKRKKAIAS